MHQKECMEQLETCYQVEEVMAFLEELFERAEEEKGYYRTIMSIAVHYLNQSNYAVCRTILLKLYAQRKTIQCIYYLALVDYRLGYDQKALGWLQKIPLEKETVKIRLLKSKIFLSDQPDKAIRLLKQLTQDFPQEYEPYELLAQYYMSQSAYGKARTYYQVLLDYFEKDIEVDTIKIELAQCLLQMEFISISEIEKLLQTLKNPVAYYLLGLSYSQGKQWDKAIELFEMCVSEDIDWVEAHVRLLELYAHTNQMERFTQKFAWLLEMLPLYDDMLYETVRIAYTDGQILPEGIEKLAMYVTLQEQDMDENWFDALALVISMIQEYYGYTPKDALAYLQQFGLEDVSRYEGYLFDERSDK